MKGSLIIVGGGLKASLNSVHAELIRRAGGEKSRFAFFSTASSLPPDELYEDFCKNYEALGVKRENIVQIPLYAPETRDKKGRNLLSGDSGGFEALMEGVSGIWFTGGDQRRIKNALMRADGSDTKLLKMLREIYLSGGVIGGTSAGAAMMSEIMIGGGSDADAVAGRVYSDYPEDGSQGLILSKGPGFFREGIVDQHFNKRPRLLRLIESLMSNNKGFKLGFGISEDTALIYSGGKIRVLGSAGVYISDCRRAEKTGPGSYKGVILSALQQGDSMDLSSGSTVLASEENAEEKLRVKDFVPELSIASPDFNRLISSALLPGDEKSLLISEDGRPCLKSGLFFALPQGDTALKFSYIKRPDTSGYIKNICSFKNIEFQSESYKL